MHSGRCLPDWAPLPGYGGSGLLVKTRSCFFDLVQSITTDLLDRARYIQTSASSDEFPLHCKEEMRLA